MPIVRNIWKDVPAPLELHKDDRGAIVDIFYKEEVNHVNSITSIKGALRGDHYHKKTTQHILMVSGSMEYWHKSVESNEPAEHIVVKKGDMVTTPPYEVHALRILEDDTEFITFSSGLRGGQDYEADTFRVEPSLIPGRTRSQAHF
jgi:dTDP-4-dehydrorhamnose 3,5-epimerase-like enzyme